MTSYNPNLTLPMTTPAARTSSLLAYLGDLSPGGLTPPRSLARGPLLPSEYVNRVAAGLLFGLYKHLKPHFRDTNSALERIKELYDRAVVLVEDYWPEIVRGLGLSYTEDRILRMGMRFVVSDRPLPSSGSPVPSLLAAYLTAEESAAPVAPQWAQRGLAYERPLLVALFYLLGGAKIRGFRRVEPMDVAVINVDIAGPRRSLARARVLSVFTAELGLLRDRILFLCALPETARSAAAFRSEIDQFVRDRQALAAVEAPAPLAA